MLSAGGSYSEGGWREGGRAGGKEKVKHRT